MSAPSFKLDWNQADGIIDSSSNEDNRSSATLVEHYRVVPSAKGSDRLWNLVEAARKVGLTVQVLPPDFKPCNTQFRKSLKCEASKRMHDESCFLFEQCNTGERVFDCKDKDGQIVISFQRLVVYDCHCIFYRGTEHKKSQACVRAARKNQREDHHPPYIMELRHRTVEVSQLETCKGSKFTLTACSGRGKEPKDIKTVFLLKGGGGGSDAVVVAKAIYEYNAIGPKLELLEVAIKSRRQGLGSSMLRAIEDYYRTRAPEDYYRTLFGLALAKPLICLQAPPKPASFSSWFQEQHFYDPALSPTDMSCKLRLRATSVSVLPAVRCKRDDIAARRRALQKAPYE
jgi:hypothetical protein